MKLRNLADVKVGVLEAYTTYTPWRPKEVVEIRNPLNGCLEVLLLKNGKQTIFPGYMCDGPSGPTFDDHINRGPAVSHDVDYQLLRLGHDFLTRKEADQRMLRSLLANLEIARVNWRHWARQAQKGEGWMAKARHWVGSKGRQALMAARYRLYRARFHGWYWGLRLRGGKAAEPRVEKKYTLLDAL